MINAMGDVRPSHLLDVGLREACGFDGATGEILDENRVQKIRGYEGSVESTSSLDKSGSQSSNSNENSNTVEFGSKSRIESLL